MKKQIIPFFASLLLLTGLFGFSPLMAQESDDVPYVIIVEFTFSEDNVDQAIEYLLEMQKQTLENEEGCSAYEVLLAEDDATKVFLYESYVNDAAYKKHTSSSYYKTIVTQKMKNLVKAQRVTKVVPLSKEEISDEEF